VFNDSEFDPLLDSPEVIVAFNLSMTALGDTVDARRAMATRTVNKIRESVRR